MPEPHLPEVASPCFLYGTQYTYTPGGDKRHRSSTAQGDGKKGDGNIRCSQELSQAMKNTMVPYTLERDSERAK